MTAINIASGALITNASALQVIGHNIANANTEGYSRQTVQLNQVPGQLFGNGYFGKGVEIGSVERSFNAFLTREANTSTSVAAADGIRYSRLQQLEQLFPMGESGMGNQLNGFLNSWADVVASPLNQTARGVVITRAEEIAARLRQSASQLDELRVTTRTQIEGGIGDVNRYAQNIADINQRIIEAYGSGKSPNDLLDQRDTLISNLNRYVQTTTLMADDKSMTVFIGGSYPLVLGATANQLVTPPPVDTAGNLSLALGNASALVNTDLLGGGELLGALRFYNDDIGDVRNQLGRMALSMMELTNRQHMAGLDLNGNPGAAFFNPIGNPLEGSVIKDLSVNADLGLRVDELNGNAPTQFKASDYVVTYAGVSEVRIQRQSDGKYLAAGYDATGIPPTEAVWQDAPTTVFFDAGNELAFDGLRLAETTTGNVGDTVLLRPFANVAEKVRVALTSPSQLAVASPLLVVPDPNNSDSLQVESLYRPGGSTLPLTAGTVIEFVSGGYTTDGGATVVPFVSGQPIEVDGFSLTLRGEPTVGDTFTVRPPNSGEVMNQNTGNGQALLALRDAVALDGYTLSDGYIPVFSAVSSSIQTAKSAATFSQSVADTATAARANAAGVNLDEEAARLLQFQQAYQASAKFLQTVQSIFDTLLQTFR
ncbi:MAG: hypothetical protein RL323_933 [Pseudomonadota bacterium]